MFLYSVHLLTLHTQHDISCLRTCPTSSIPKRTQCCVSEHCSMSSKHNTVLSVAEHCSTSSIPKRTLLSVSEHCSMSSKHNTVLSVTEHCSTSSIPKGPQFNIMNYKNIFVHIKLNATFRWHCLLSQVYFKHTVLSRMTLWLSSGQHYRTCFVWYVRLSWQCSISQVLRNYFTW